jgi:hypothetical protein
MKANVGGVDRVVRIVVGLAIIGVGIAYQSWWGAIGLIPLTTGVLRWCPAYCPLKVSSAKNED